MHIVYRTTFIVDLLHPTDSIDLLKIVGTEPVVIDRVMGVSDQVVEKCRVVKHTFWESDRQLSII